eukprot:gene5399-6887_t
MHGEPLTTAVALSLLLSELAQPPYNNIFCSFSSEPVIHEIVGETLYDRYRSIVQTNWEGKKERKECTNFNAVFSLILNRAVAVNLPAEDMIRTVFVFSDMEFDRAEGTRGVTNFQAARLNFLSEDYVLPRLVFWNLSGNRRFDDSGPGASVPVRQRNRNVVLFAGSSGKLLSNFMEGMLGNYVAEDEVESDDEEETPKINPLNAMMVVIKS